MAKESFLRQLLGPSGSSDVTQLSSRRRGNGRRAIAWAAIGAFGVWLFAGRWLLYPLLGAGKLSEPKEVRGREVHRIKRPDGTELHVEVFGAVNSPTLVLTHGWRHDSTQWYYVQRDLAQRFRLIVWDLPGTGKSTQSASGDYSIERMSRDLESVVQVAKGPVVLVGLSLGGMVVQTFCRLFPQHLGQRIAGLVLMDTTYTNPMKTARWSPFWRAIQSPILVPMWYATIALSPPARAVNWLSYSSGSMHLMKRLLGFAGHQTWREIDFSARLSARSLPAVDARMALAALGFDEWDALPGITVPVLVVAGENDRLTTLETAEQIQRRIPAARLAVIPNAGHYALFEQHEAVGKVIADFAEACGKGRGSPGEGFDRQGCEVAFAPSDQRNA